MLSDLEDEENLPDDLKTSDRYLAVPHRNDLDLGRRLVLMVHSSQRVADAGNSGCGRRLCRVSRQCGPASWCRVRKMTWRPLKEFFDALDLKLGVATTYPR